MSAASKIRKIFKWFLFTFLCCFFIFFYGVVPWFLTGITTSSGFHFHDPNDGKTPKDFGMDFHPIEFHSTDGILLKGWYIPAAADPSKARGTIVYAHGLNRTRIEMLPYAAFGHSLGYNGVLFDLRHQGQSGGKISTIGYQERLDVEAAVHYALTEEKASRPVVLWGVSMGAAAVLMAGAEAQDVAAVISDSAFPNFKELILHHYTLFLGLIRRRAWWFPPLPSFPLADEVIYWSAWRGHFSPSDFDLEKAVRRINPRPILFVCVAGDLRMPPAYAKTMFAESTSPLKKMVELGGFRHGEGFKYATKQYEEAVKEFLASLPGKPPQPAAP
ncbi:MAG TPA: alpha/beta hydrolase [Terriglobia bacterium]|nr:alpha/beta hydrolase [Terriglobia bacterium]